MRARDLLALDFPRVLEEVARFAVSPTGKEMCARRRPTADAAAAAAELERVAECVCLIDRSGDPPLREFPDCRAHLHAAAHEGFVLDGRSLLEIRTTLTVARAVRAYFTRHADASPRLAGIAGGLVSFPELETTLQRSLDDDGGVPDQASDELAQVRRSIRRLRETLQERLEELVRRRGMEDIVGDEYVTLRNDRFVIPVRASSASRLSGVVQDRSVSGETLFVEPLFAVDLNNQLMMAIRDEEMIVRKILADLTALVRLHGRELEVSFAALAAADELVARARFARAFHCTAPQLGTADVTLRAARHPGLLFTGRPVTPVDLLLGADSHVLIVTGPNTGGKTVALKTFGLCALMAQSGLLVPAQEGARLPVFSGVFTDVGDEQSVERNLSTFSAHIANLCEILATIAGSRETGSGSEEANPPPASLGPAPPLILLDEPGVGTDPDEGAALAIGLLQQFERIGARLVVTTHFTPVKLFAATRPGFVVAAVDFDVDRLEPSYRLQYGSLGRSLALPIAERLGLPSAVLDAARASQGEAAQRLDAALSDLHRRRTELEELTETARSASVRADERERESVRLERELRERRRSAWQTELHEARELVRRWKAEGREAVEALRKDLRRRPDAMRTIRAIETQIEQTEAGLGPDPSAAEPASVATTSRPVVGDEVVDGDHRLHGRLLEVDGDRAWVQRGSMRFEVPYDRLRKAAPDRGGAAVHVAYDSPGESTPAEISLLGLRAREAVVALERFLDRAVQAGLPSVRVVHGFGSGALRRAVRDYLADSPYGADFRDGEPNEGGGGVTIVGLER